MNSDWRQALHLSVALLKIASETSVSCFIALQVLHQALSRCPIPSIEQGQISDLLEAVEKCLARGSNLDALKAIQAVAKLLTLVSEPMQVMAMGRIFDRLSDPGHTARLFLALSEEFSQSTVSRIRQSLQRSMLAHEHYLVNLLATKLDDEIRGLVLTAFMSFIATFKRTELCSASMHLYDEMLKSECLFEQCAAILTDVFPLLVESHPLLAERHLAQLQKIRPVLDRMIVGRNCAFLDNVDPPEWTAQPHTKALQQVALLLRTILEYATLSKDRQVPLIKWLLSLASLPGHFPRDEQLSDELFQLWGILQELTDDTIELRHLHQSFLTTILSKMTYPAGFELMVVERQRWDSEQRQAWLEYRRELGSILPSIIRIWPECSVLFDSICDDLVTHARDWFNASPTFHWQNLELNLVALAAIGEEKVHVLETSAETHREWQSEEMANNWRRASEMPSKTIAVLCEMSLFLIEHWDGANFVKESRHSLILLAFMSCLHEFQFAFPNLYESNNVEKSLHAFCDLCLTVLRTAGNSGVVTLLRSRAASLLLTLARAHSDRMGDSPLVFDQCVKLLPIIRGSKPRNSVLQILGLLLSAQPSESPSIELFKCALRDTVQALSDCFANSARASSELMVMLLGQLTHTLEGLVKSSKPMHRVDDILKQLLTVIAQATTSPLQAVADALSRPPVSRSFFKLWSQICRLVQERPTFVADIIAISARMSEAAISDEDRTNLLQLYPILLQSLPKQSRGPVLTNCVLHTARILKVAQPLLGLVDLCEEAVADPASFSQASCVLHQALLISPVVDESAYAFALSIGLAAASSPQVECMTLGTQLVTDCKRFGTMSLRPLDVLVMINLQLFKRTMLCQNVWLNHASLHKVLMHLDARAQTDAVRSILADNPQNLFPAGVPKVAEPTLLRTNTTQRELAKVLQTLARKN